MSDEYSEENLEKNVMFMVVNDVNKLLHRILRSIRASIFSISIFKTVQIDPTLSRVFRINFRDHPKLNSAQIKLLIGRKI